MPLPPLSPNAWMRWDEVSRWMPSGARDVLEVGCGQGGFGARLAGHYEYTGIEMDALASAVARARIEAVGNGRVIHGNMSSLEPEALFDIVCAFEVIEHIEEDLAALAEWVERLRPGGWLILSTPAFQKRFDAADVMAGHFRRYEPSDMSRMLGGLGLCNVDVRQFGGPLGYVLEAGRNHVGRRRNSRESDASKAELTSGSGRLLQPSTRLQGAVTASMTWPFRQLQRASPGHGPGLVVRAQRSS